MEKRGLENSLNQDVTYRVSEDDTPLVVVEVREERVREKEKEDKRRE